MTLIFCVLPFFSGLPLFVVFASAALWKDAATAKLRQTIPVRQHFVGNDSIADRLSRTEAMPVIGDVAHH